MSGFYGFFSFLFQLIDFDLIYNDFHNFTPVSPDVIKQFRRQEWWRIQKVSDSKIKKKFTFCESTPNLTNFLMEFDIFCRFHPLLSTEDLQYIDFWSEFQSFKEWLQSPKSFFFFSVEAIQTQKSEELTHKRILLWNQLILRHWN